MCLNNEMIIKLEGHSKSTDLHSGQMSYLSMLMKVKTNLCIRSVILIPSKMNQFFLGPCHILRPHFFKIWAVMSFCNPDNCWVTELLTDKLNLKPDFLGRGNNVF